MKKRLLSLMLAVAMVIGLPIPAFAAKPTFTDVPETYWGYADIEAVAAAGLMNGVDGGAFSPETTVTVAQFLTLLGRLVFLDVKTESRDWYSPYVAKAKESGLLTGTQVDTKDVQAEISRYDMAVILRAAAKKLGLMEKTAQPSQVTDYLDIPNQYTEAVLAVYGMGLIQGDEAGNFNGSSSMKRVEVATVMVRLLKFANEEQTPETEQIPSDEEMDQNKPDLEGARKAIIQCLTNMEEKVDTTPYHIKEEDLEALVIEIVNSRPDEYYVFSIYWGPYDPNNGLSTEVGFLYYGTKEQYNQYKQDVKEARAKAEEIVASTVRPGMSDYEIAKALHDYLVLNVEYNYNWKVDIYDFSKSGPGYGIYFPLIEHKAVCSGYSDAYKYLLNLAGIPCEYISGNADGTDEIAAEIGYRWGVSHAWNIVQIEGEWYHVDVTWDDLGGDGIRYDYFLKSDQALKGHYDWEAPYPCTSTKYDDISRTLNEQQQAEKEAEKNAAIMADFMERFNALPFRSAEGLTGTDELSDEELLSYYKNIKVYYPMDEYTYTEMKAIYFVVAHSRDGQIFKLNEQFTEMSYEDDQWYLVVWRWDIWREYERRHGVD